MSVMNAKFATAITSINCVGLELPTGDGKEVWVNGIDTFVQSLPA
jgi:hypothetical protein